MPQGDGTGPTGKGPRTGRGLGRCQGQDASNAGDQVRSGPIGRFLFNRGGKGGRGKGRGRGSGWGWRKSQ
jgi:hypothetical protein